MAKLENTGVKKPTALKKLQGTYRADRANPKEPQLPVELPDRPVWVDDDPTTAKLFDQVTEYITEMKIATRVDGLALSLLADQLALYLTLREDVKTNGPTLTAVGSQGQETTKPNPSLIQLSAVYNNIYKMLRDYGLTAASRSGVSAIEDTGDDFESFLKG